jgi:hypothetical protein
MPPTSVQVPSEEPRPSNKIKDLEPEDLAQLYAKYTLLTQSLAYAMRRLDPQEMDAARIRVTAEPPTPRDLDILNPAIPEEDQLELEENAELCEIEPKSFDE